MSSVKSTARSIALDALVDADCGNSFLETTLKEWLEGERPAKRDLGLAREIAYGTMRRKLSLQYITLQLVEKGRLSLKRWEKWLLWSAVYQKYYMDKVPDYAIIGESMLIARSRRSHNIRFLGAILNKIVNINVDLPAEKHIQYSYPLEYVDLLKGRYSEKEVDSILEAGNEVSDNYVRVRNQSERLLEGLEWYDKDLSLARIMDNNIISDLSTSYNYYIQDYTPVALIANLAKGLKPNKILDLCSAPGGKAIAIHDLYPESELYLNDVSEVKLALLGENISKYNIKAHYSQQLGQSYSSSERFDLIIIDAPCSNSGTLSRRPEARWRLSAEDIAEHVVLQRELVKQCSTLLNYGGVILYMTCSILPQENEDIVEYATLDLQLESSESKLYLPTSFCDGGYGAVFYKNK